MRKIFLFLSVLIFTAVVCAQNPVVETLTKRELAIKQIDYTLEKSIVFEELRKCLLELKKADKDGKALPSRKYSKYSIMLGYYSKYSWFIADTGLSKKWLSDVYKLIKYMQKTRDIIETATINRHTHTEKYKQAVKYFDVAYERFVKLVEKPVKVSSKVQRKAKLDKSLWQKAMRKKYKIKEKITTEEF